MKNYDEFLKEFISTNDSYPDMCRPVSKGEFVFATNGHILIKIPKSLLHNTYNENLFSEKIENAFKSIKYSDPIIIDWQEADRIFNKIPKYPEFGECISCEGSGFTECDHCGSETDCDSCNGSGESKKIIKMECDKYKDMVKISDGYFNPNYINLLITAAKLELAEIKILSVGNASPMAAKVGRLEMLIMPIKADDTSDINIHELTFNPCPEGK